MVKQTVGSTTSHINRTELLEFVGHDEDLLADIAMLFAKSWEDCKARLRLAIMEENAALLCETAYSLKSRLVSFRVPHLMSSAAKLEQLGKQGLVPSENLMLSELLASIEEMVSELADMTRLELLRYCAD